MAAPVIQCANLEPAQHRDRTSSRGLQCLRVGSQPMSESYVEAYWRRVWALTVTLAAVVMPARVSRLNGSTASLVVRPGQRRAALSGLAPAVSKP